MEVMKQLRQRAIRDLVEQRPIRTQQELAAALRGELTRGLFFRGASSVPFGPAIRPVHELIDYLLTGHKPAAAGACVGSAAGAAALVLGVGK